MGTLAPTPAPTPAPTQAPTPVPTAKLIGAGCCRPFNVILNATRRRTRADCMHQCEDNPSCNAFAISGCSSSSDEQCGGGCHIYALNSAQETYAAPCHESNGFTGITPSTYCFVMR